MRRHEDLGHPFFAALHVFLLSHAAAEQPGTAATHLAAWPLAKAGGGLDDRTKNSTRPGGKLDSGLSGPEACQVGGADGAAFATGEL